MHSKSAPAKKKEKMPPGAHILRRDRQRLELELLSSSVRLQLTRMLRRSVTVQVGEEAHLIELIRKNQAINIANSVLGKPIYVLELRDWDYAHAEHAWHNRETVSW